MRSLALFHPLIPSARFRVWVTVWVKQKKLVECPAEPRFSLPVVLPKLHEPRLQQCGVLSLRRNNNGYQIAHRHQRVASYRPYPLLQEGQRIRQSALPDYQSHSVCPLAFSSYVFFFHLSQSAFLFLRTVAQSVEVGHLDSPPMYVRLNLNGVKLLK